MSKFARSLLILIPLIALLPVQTKAAENDVKLDNYVGRAKRFFRDLYPNLDGALSLTIRDHNRLAEPDLLNFFTMELYEPDGPPYAQRMSLNGKIVDLPPKPGPCPSECRCSNPILSGDFLFDWQRENKELLRLQVWGPAATCRLEKLAGEVDKHLDWADETILAALESAAPKFGPDHEAEFLRGLPLAKLRPFVGKLEVESAEFSVREPAGDGSGRMKAELTWSVRGKWRSADGRKEADCFMKFEPFEGRLLMFRRTIEATKGQE